jgi:hypothetical protein
MYAAGQSVLFGAPGPRTSKLLIKEPRPSLLACAHMYKRALQAAQVCAEPQETESGALEEMCTEKLPIVRLLAFSVHTQCYC